MLSGALKNYSFKKFRKKSLKTPLGEYCFGEAAGRQSAALLKQDSIVDVFTRLLRLFKV